MQKKCGGYPKRLRRMGNGNRHASRDRPGSPDQASVLYLPYHTDYDALNCDLPGQGMNRLEIRVGRLEADRVSFPVKAFERCLAVLGQGDDGLAVSRVGASLADDIVAVAD